MANVNKPNRSAFIFLPILAEFRSKFGQFLINFWVNFGQFFIELIIIIIMN